MSSTSVEQIAVATLGLDISVLKPEIHLARIPGWDSLKFMKLLVAIEKKLSIVFEAADVARVTTWGDLLDLVQRQQAALN